MKRVLLILLFISSIASAQYQPFDWYGKSAPSAVVYDTSAQRLFAKITATNTTMSVERKQLISDLYIMFKDSLGVASLSNFFDLLYFLDYGDEAPAKLDWANNYDITKVGSITFDSSGCQTLLDYTSYLNTNYIPSTNYVNRSRNSGSIGIYIKEQQSSSRIDFGASYTHQVSFMSYFSGSVWLLDNSQGPALPASPRVIGLHITNRLTSDSLQYIRNDTLLNTVTQATSGLPDVKLYIGARNMNGTADYNSLNKYGLFFVAKKLTAVERRKIINIYTYWTSHKNSHSLYPPVTDYNKIIICDGNSLTWGFPLTYRGSYPSQLSTLFFPNVLVYNYGVNGDWTQSLKNRLDAGYAGFQSGKNNIYIPWECLNMINNGGLNWCHGADTVYQLYKTLCLDAKSHGFTKVLATTVTLMYPLGGRTCFEPTRLAVNDSIRNNWATFADGLADLGADTLIGQTGQQTNTTYYADGLHFTAAGYNRIANIIYNVIKDW